ncbi:MAG: class I SAM-dependent methyltransferase [Anaerolineae bacterium]|jgi:SAM-dependent methyltransferase
MSRQDLVQQWRALSPDWIKESRGRNANRKGLLDKPILEACGDVSGLSVLDCGCGEGRFSRMVVSRGAKYALGLDLCKPMIDAARALESGVDEYRVADVQEMSFIADETFDVAVSYLNQCDLPDFVSNTREVFRVLKPGARFVVANLHPMRSATGGWHKDETGRKLHAVIDSYFDEGERHWEVWGKELTNFHRSLSTYLDGFLEAGFVLARVIEPTVALSDLKQYPELEDELRVPNFIIYVLDKPSRTR